MVPRKYPANNPKLQLIESVASVMDNKFRVPGTRFRFGLDPVLNLVPGLGAVSGFIISGGLLLTISRYGASGKVIILMLINIVLDTLIGAIPVLGWLFDFAYKANIRNVNLLKAHYEQGKHQGSGKGLITGIILILLILFAAVIYLLWQLIVWISGVGDTLLHAVFE